MSPRRSRGCPTSSRSRPSDAGATASCGRCAAYQQTRLQLLRDLSSQTAQLEIATGLGGVAVAVVGAGMVAQGQLAATTLPLLILLALASFLPISEIAQVSRQLADTIASTRRYYAVHQEEPAVRDGPARPPAPVGGSAIRFDDVAFAYPGARRPALDGVRLAIPAGATAAIVGPSGAGKTTLANLLLRFWDPATGRILIDGVDLREFELDHLRRRISLVSQDTYLFNDTLRANVLLARPDADEAAIERALEQAALAEFVASLPEGLDTRVGERGVQLSGGQRQRVAIARAFLKNAPTLILDEATSHLDAVSEAQVRGALDTLMRDRTTDRHRAPPLDGAACRSAGGARSRPRRRVRHPCRAGCPQRPLRPPDPPPARRCARTDAGGRELNRGSA